MNSVNLIGRLTRDPEVRYSQSNMAVARFSIAIDRPPRQDGTKETDFPNIVVFGRQAENCEKYLEKGRLVGISGRIQTGSYVNREGNRVYTTEVVANRVEFLSWGDNQGQGRNQQRSYQQSAPSPAQQPQQNGFTGQVPSQDPYSQNAPEQEQTQPSSIPQGFEAIDDDDIPF